MFVLLFFFSLIACCAVVFFIFVQAFNELERRDVYNSAKKDKVIILEEDLEIGENTACKNTRGRAYIRVACFYLSPVRVCRLRNLQRIRQTMLALYLSEELLLAVVMMLCRERVMPRG